MSFDGFGRVEGPRRDLNGQDSQGLFKSLRIRASYRFSYWIAFLYG